MIPRPVTSYHLLREQSCNLVAHAPTRHALRGDLQVARSTPRCKTEANHGHASPHAEIGRLEAVSTRFFSRSFWNGGMSIGGVGILDGCALHSRERVKSNPMRPKSRKPCQRAKSRSNQGPDPSTPEIPVKPGDAARKSRRCRWTWNPTQQLNLAKLSDALTLPVQPSSCRCVSPEVIRLHWNSSQPEFATKCKCGPTVAPHGPCKFWKSSSTNRDGVIGRGTSLHLTGLDTSAGFGAGLAPTLPG